MNRASLALFGALSGALTASCIAPTVVPDAPEGTLDAPAVDAPVADAPGLDAPLPDAPGTDAPMPGVDGGPGVDAAGTCTSGPECQDGVFCNGIELCAPGSAGADAHGCVSGTPPCTGACDEDGRACAASGCECDVDADCDDARACNGAETCVAGACVAGTAVTCPSGRACREPSGACDGCTTDAACRDSTFCNGLEVCVGGVCQAGTNPCPVRSSCREGSIRDGIVAGCTCTTVSQCNDGRFCTTDACSALTGTCSWTPRSCPMGGCSDTASACTTDVDGDGEVGAAYGGSDCDDGDPEIGPGHMESCDPAGRDEDCDPTTFGDRDMDGDGVVSSACCNGTTCGGDCNDGAPSIHPTAAEVCNALDDDCDAAIDESVLVMQYRDRDSDGYGDALCSDLRCAGTTGWTTRTGDCDDTRPSLHLGAIQCDPDGAGVDQCTDTGWVVAACPPGTTCRPQPDGTGICI